MTNPTTPNQGYVLPVETQNLKLYRALLEQNLIDIDQDIAALAAALAEKATLAQFQALIGGFELLANKNVSNGYAGLDASARIPAALLPSYVDDVVEFATLAAFPATGEAGKIYVAINNGRVYRWSGSAYVEISAAPGTTDAVPEGATNLYYTNARVLAALSANANTARSNIGAAAASHTHAIANVEGLQASLDARSTVLYTANLSVDSATGFADFIGIPPSARVIKCSMRSLWALTGATRIYAQLGTDSGFVNSGYSGVSDVIGTSVSMTRWPTNLAPLVDGGLSVSNSYDGLLTLERYPSLPPTWGITYFGHTSLGTVGFQASFGSTLLSSPLTRLRIGAEGNWLSGGIVSVIAES